MVLEKITNLKGYECPYISFVENCFALLLYKRKKHSNSEETISLSSEKQNLVTVSIVDIWYLFTYDERYLFFLQIIKSLNHLSLKNNCKKNFSRNEQSFENND